MKNLFIFTSLCLSPFAFSQSISPVPATPEVQIINEDSSLKSFIQPLTEAAAHWTPEQKQEFADVFFTERGKFTIPKEPIQLKYFKSN